MQSVCSVASLILIVSDATGHFLVEAHRRCRTRARKKGHRLRLRRGVSVNTTALLEDLSASLGVPVASRVLRNGFPELLTFTGQNSAV